MTPMIAYATVYSLAFVYQMRYVGWPAELRRSGQLDWCCPPSRDKVGNDVGHATWARIVVSFPLGGGRTRWGRGLRGMPGTHSFPCPPPSRGRSSRRVADQIHAEQY